MTNHENRGRIMVRPLGISYWSRPATIKTWTAVLSTDWKPIAELVRGLDDEILVRNSRTGIYMGLTMQGALRSVESHKITAALAAAGINGETDNA